MLFLEAISNRNFNSTYKKIQICFQVSKSFLTFKENLSFYFEVWISLNSNLKIPLTFKNFNFEQNMVSFKIKKLRLVPVGDEVKQFYPT